MPSMDSHNVIGIPLMVLLFYLLHRITFFRLEKFHLLRIYYIMTSHLIFRSGLYYFLQKAIDDKGIDHAYHRAHEIVFRKNLILQHFESRQ